MANTTVAIGGVGLVIASAWTSGRGKTFLDAVGSANAAPVIATGVEFLVELLFVGILAVMGDSSYKPIAITILIGLWIIWAVDYYTQQAKKAGK